ncbi:anti-sigma factor antagonist [Actinomadura craniellae]|uniref:Anti-sigma factor antagonist n=1 Tax=Actinomadura craniellae TaxID=2231787 RepID=A0A365HDU7_9ACTN|nr:STAS domain-containing protein [Actinomadura craniellae]RAY17188.1 anti-sigma factor antagonist [Actinomadura craniellae]
MTGTTEVLQVTTGRTGLWMVVELAGELDVAALPLFHQEIERVCAGTPAPRVIIDLSAVTFMDSCGLGGLVRAWKQIGGPGGRLVLAGVNGRVREVLRITGMLAAFEIWEGVPGPAGE